MKSPSAAGTAAHIRSHTVEDLVTGRFDLGEGRELDRIRRLVCHEVSPRINKSPPNRVTMTPIALSGCEREGREANDACQQIRDSIRIVRHTAAWPIR